jgi:protein tyrosine kinase modulator
MPEEAGWNRRGIEAPSPTARDIFAVLFRQRTLWYGTFAGIFLIILLYGIFVPSYQAHMQVLVRRRRADPVMTPQPIPPGEFSSNEITEEELNSEAELLRDEELLRKVVSATGLDTSERFFRFSRNDQGAQIERAARRLAKHLRAETVRKTNLIDVRYDSTDPALAAHVLNVLADLYVQKHTSLHRPSGEYHFFEQQTAEYGDRLKDAELKLLDFTRDQGVISAAMERDMALQKLSEADASYRQVRLAMAETEQRISILQRQLPSLPERTTTLVRTAENTQLMEKLKSKLLDLELQRTDLLTKYEPSYRLVQEVEQQISEARAAIATEQVTPPRDETTEKDATYEWARTELEKAQVELSGLQARAATAERQLAYCRKDALGLAEASVNQENLLRTMKAAEENYLLYVQKREEARIGDALDERGILNVIIAERPTVPALPTHSALFVGAVGFVIAAVLSTGFAFARDFLDPAFRTPDEVVEFLGAPVLASLPRQAA